MSGVCKAAGGAHSLCASTCDWPMKRACSCKELLPVGAAGAFFGSGGVSCAPACWWSLFAMISGGQPTGGHLAPAGVQQPGAGH
eukprot:3953150-Amphidinium_carterae.1